MALIPYISELQRLVATTAVLAAAAFTASSTHAADESKGKKVLLLESFTAHPLCRDHREIVPRTRFVVWHGGDGSGLLDWTLRCRPAKADDGIARKFDLIVIQPISEQGIVPVLTRAKQAGIPVIIVNNTPKDGTEELYVTFVGQDQNEMGRIAGKAALQALKESGRDGGKVALITGALQQGPGPRRVAGFKEVVAANLKLEIAAIEDGRWDTCDQRTARRPALCALRRQRRPRCRLRYGRQSGGRRDQGRGCRRHHRRHRDRSSSSWSAATARRKGSTPSAPARCIAR
jgi:hypothetical protein